MAGQAANVVLMCVAQNGPLHSVALVSTDKQLSFEGCSLDVCPAKYGNGALWQ